MNAKVVVTTNHNDISSKSKQMLKLKMFLDGIGKSVKMSCFYVQDFKAYTPPEVYIKHTSWEDVCMWEPSHTKVQVCGYLVGATKT